MAPQEQARPRKKKIIVVGAGPAGLLSCIFLLRRSDNYDITLIDPGVDYGKLDEAGLSRFRSWMIGLTAHGLHAVKQVPGLFEDYISAFGVMLDSATFAYGKKIKFNYSVDETTKASSGFLVDRNYICGALAKYLNDKFSAENISFVSHYNTRALFVDKEKQRLIVRSVNKDSTLPQKDTMVSLEYDYLLGCDGIRSIVRNGFITHHRDFEFDLIDSFGEGRAVHIPLPNGVSAGQFMILMECLPNITSFCLPERGQQLNVAFGWSYDKPCDPELVSKDPKVVSKYLKENFTAFEIDPDEFAEKWVAQDTGTGQFIHCNFYHSHKLNALLMGDAAHATMPNIGQGMNTAFADAFVLDQLLDKYDDDWQQVLPAFSEERVKEGNALSDLSFHTFSLDPKMQLEIIMRQNARRFLNSIFPEWLVEKEPMNRIAIEGKSLSWAYDKVTKYGYLVKSRQVNTEIKRKYFEKKTGMVTEEPKGSVFRSLFWLLAIIVAVTSYLVGKGILV